MIWYLVILLPIVAAVLALFFFKERKGAGWLFLLASVPALWIGVYDTAGIEAGWFVLGSSFLLDAPRKIILLLTAIIWAVAGSFASPYLQQDTRRHEFLFFFGIAMAGNFGLLIAADVISFYTFFALMTFASYGLVIHSRTPSARTAAGIYIKMAIVGELFLITSFWFGITAADSLMLRDIAPAIAEAPNGIFIYILGLIGFGVKVGAIPLYFWLPLAHPAAPAPASAVLSAAMIKAGLVGWMHLSPIGLVAWDDIGVTLMILGIAAAIGAALFGLTQIDPKTNLAYSSVSQMGIMTVMLGAGLCSKITAELLFISIAIYAFNHGIAKALLFLGTTLPAKVSGIWRPLMWTGIIIAALSIAGAPLTGGFWTKLQAKSILSSMHISSNNIFVVLLSISAITSSLLLSRFVHLLKDKPKPTKKYTPIYFLPWIFLLAVSAWWLFGYILSPSFTEANVLPSGDGFSPLWDLSTLWKSSWPIALGILIYLFTIWQPTLNKWPTREASLPAGDFIWVLSGIQNYVIRNIGDRLHRFSLVMQSRQSAENIMYSFLDHVKTISVSKAIETALTRWEFVGISFFVLFAVFFYFLR